MSVGIARGGCRGRGGGESGRRRARSPVPDHDSDGGIARRRAPGCTARARRGRSRQRSRAPRRTCARRARGIRRPGAPRRARGPAWSPPARATRDARRNRRGRRRGRLLVRHARRRARRRRRGPESGSQRAAHLDALQRAACAPGTSGAARARATPKSVPPAQRAFARPCETGAGRVDRRASRSSKSAHCRSSVSRTTGGESSRRVRLILPRASRCRIASTRLSRLGSPLDPRLASRPVRGRCHTVCFTATPGYPLHTFPTSGCQPIAAGRRLGWV